MGVDSEQEGESNGPVDKPDFRRATGRGTVMYRIVLRVPVLPMKSRSRH